MPGVGFARPPSAANGDEFSLAIGEADQIIAVTGALVGPLLDIFPADSVARRHPPAAVSHGFEDAFAVVVGGRRRRFASGDGEVHARQKRQNHECGNAEKSE